MSINMPQLIFQRAESAHHKSVKQLYLVGSPWGKGDFCLRGGGGGGIPGFPSPCMKPWYVCVL